jgi:hypothetical protein
VLRRKGFVTFCEKLKHGWLETGTSFSPLGISPPELKRERLVRSKHSLTLGTKQSHWLGAYRIESVSRGTRNRFALRKDNTQPVTECVPPLANPVFSVDGVPLKRLSYCLPGNVTERQSRGPCGPPSRAGRPAFSLVGRVATIFFGRFRLPFSAYQIVVSSVNHPVRIPEHGRV